METYLGLFISAFLAATLLPFSSEVVLAALYAVDEFDPWLLWVLATAGNTLGGILNWVLGRYCLKWQDRRWFPFKEDQLTKAQHWFERYGKWSLLLAWLPLIGDPITFAAGILRIRLGIFIVLVGFGKGVRYAVVLLIAYGLI
ncbi:MAG: YqaA family protein [Alphaproteobacteria bacterium]|jgi:membrane protein YqaA with SNARE-associated domain